MPRPYRLVIAGSREFTHPRFVDQLDELVPAHLATLGLEIAHLELVVVSGRQVGMDLAGEAWAKARGHGIDPYPADWTRYGNAAGPIRNQKMIDTKPDSVLINALLESRGSFDLMQRARRASIPCTAHRRARISNGEIFMPSHGTWVRYSEDVWPTEDQGPRPKKGLGGQKEQRAERRKRAKAARNE